MCEKEKHPTTPHQPTAASRGKAAPAQARAHWLAGRRRGTSIGRAGCQSGAGRRARRRGRGGSADPVSREAAESLQSLPPPHSTGSSAAVARPRGEGASGPRRPPVCSCVRGPVSRSVAPELPGPAAWSVSRPSHELGGSWTRGGPAAKLSSGRVRPPRRASLRRASADRGPPISE